MLLTSAINQSIKKAFHTMHKSQGGGCSSSFFAGYWHLLFGAFHSYLLHNQCCNAAAAQTLTLETFANTALVGPPTYQTQIHSLSNVSISNPSSSSSSSSPWSARVQGTLNLTTFDHLSRFVFDCSSLMMPQTNSTNITAGFVWIDDHLICQKSIALNQTRTYEDAMDGATSAIPLLRLRKPNLPIRIHLWSSSSTIDYSLRWFIMSPKKEGGEDGKEILSYEDIPSDLLSRNVSDVEKQRQEMALKLNQGWGTWLHHSLTDFILLPEGIKAGVRLCQMSTNQCLGNAIPTDPNVRVTAPVIVDSAMSYMKYYVGFAGVNVSITMSGKRRRDRSDEEKSPSSSSWSSPQQSQDDVLSILAETVTCPDEDCSDYTIHVIGDIAYQPFRSGFVSKRDNDMGINITAIGLRSVVVYPTNTYEASSSWKPMTVNDGNDHIYPSPKDDKIVVPLPKEGQCVGFTTDSSPVSTSKLKHELKQIEQDEVTKLGQRYGYINNENSVTSMSLLVEVSLAVQAGVLYNLIYTPAEVSPISVISRNWWYTKETFKPDLDYIIFNWDNVLASYILSKTTRTTSRKHIAYSNLIQVVKSKTANGFIPNYSSNGAKSQDRTEPPLAAKVLYELYNDFKDTWIVELLWDDIADYIDWFDRERILQPLGLIALGSNPFGYSEATSPHNMQGARFESGCDNSPMYDGKLYDPQTNLMQMYDVGMTSLYIQECDYLSKLALIINDHKGYEEMKHRANAMRYKLLHHLWDPNQMIFANRHPNGTFSNRISPTSFYPLGVLDPNDIHGKASNMINHWFFNNSRFCIDGNLNDDYIEDDGSNRNDDDCWWGLPSISADDPAFSALGYWRGYIWGPMAQLTYWSLHGRYFSSRSSSTFSIHMIASKARKALSKQMGSMFLSMWRRHAHVCENFSPHKDAGDCTGDKFYHWGALAGLLLLLEEEESSSSSTSSSSPSSLLLSEK